MGKYKVLEEFNLNGIIRKKDSIVDLEFRLANLKSIQGKIEKVPDNTELSDGSVLGSIVPGVQLTPEQKEKLAKENAAATAEAHAMAAEQHALDIKEGRGEPAVQAVASALKDKLTNEEFQTNPPNPTPDDAIKPAEPATV